jgi:phage terminase large subunit GpA-like protein
VGTNPAKDHISTLINNQDPGENYVHLPVAFPKRYEQEQYLDKETLYQLTSEKKVYEYKGSKRIGIWKQMRDRNEALDCFVYAYAALLALGPDVFSKLDDLAKKVAALEAEPSVPTEKEPNKQLPTIYSKGVRLHPSKVTGFNVFKR